MEPCKSAKWDSGQVTKGVREPRLPSWRVFDQFVQSELLNVPGLIYRGQADADWPVESTIDRLEKRYPQKRNTLGGIPEYFDCPPTDRVGHLRAFKEVSQGRRGPNPPEVSDDEWWAIGQHHGLATPLLDWTRSPFVALFFAFEEERCTLKDGGFDTPDMRVVLTVAWHLIGDSKNSKSPTAFSPKRDVGQRRRSQSGVFLKMPEHTDLESYVQQHFNTETYSKPIARDANPHPCAILRKILIPNSDRVDCLKYLDQMNVNRATLFPDMDGAATYINKLWELDFDTSLGCLPE